MQKVDYPILSFETQKLWRDWLEKHSTTSQGVWLKFYKKSSLVRSVTYAEALDEALCFGWIDSQIKGFDDKAYIQKFTPRRSKSMWSKVNRDNIERLIKEGKMHEAGLLQVEAAKKDGRWDAAYDSPKNMVVPEEFMRELAKHRKAYAFFQTLTKANTYAIAWNLYNAKKLETRQRRMKKFIEMLEKGEKSY